VLLRWDEVIKRNYFGWTLVLRWSCGRNNFYIKDLYLQSGVLLQCFAQPFQLLDVRAVVSVHSLRC
jgi:hypothetical protein